MNNKDLQLLREASEEVTNPKFQELNKFITGEKQNQEAARTVEQYFRLTENISTAISNLDGFLSTPEFQKFFEEWIESGKFETTPLYDKNGEEISIDDLTMIIPKMRDIVELFI